MPINHLPASATPEDLAAALAHDAVVVVDRLAPTATMDRIEEELAPWVAATPPGTDPFSGSKTRRTGGLLARSPASRELVTHPLVLATVGRVLAHPTAFQLHLTQAIAIGPGEQAQQIHRDQWAFDFFPFPPGYEVQGTTIWALTDLLRLMGYARGAYALGYVDDLRDPIAVVHPNVATEGFGDVERARQQLGAPQPS